MRTILLCLLLTPSLCAGDPGTEFRPYDHSSSTARLRAALHQEQRATSPEKPARPARSWRQKPAQSTSTYFVPPKGMGSCANGRCLR